MKILHVITSLDTGGAEKLMVDLLPLLSKYGHQVDLCVFDGSRTAFYTEAQKKGIKIIDFGVGNSVYSLKNILQLRKLIRNYDIIHTHNTSPQFFTAIANIGIGKKLITTEHNTHNRRRRWPGFVIIDRIMYSSYKSIICISDKAQENLERYLGKTHTGVKTIYNGVDTKSFSDSTPSNELRNYMPSNGRAIIMVAAFRAQKDQDTLIETIGKLPSNFHLFLVGEGERMEKCRALSAHHNLTDRVHFLGRRGDIGNLLKASDFIVMSSHYEGLSLSSIEGMCVGKPFIASNVDGLREIVKDAGILFTHQDSSELAGIILDLDSNASLYEKTGKKCLERAIMYDITTMAQQYNELYKEIDNTK